MATFYTGNTGRSTGPHLDLRVYNPQTGGYEDPSKYTSFLTVGDKAFDYEVTSGYGMRNHPFGGYKMHDGIDYATPTGTALTVNGALMSTWKDDTGGIMSQYLINTEDGHRELLLLHGSADNQITGTGAVTEYDPASYTARPIDTQDMSDAPGKRVEAKERAMNYSTMNKAELDSAYDDMRATDAGKARVEGMKMHKARFGKI